MNSQSMILSPAARALFESVNAMGKLTAVISTNVEYAEFQEYGTARMAAHPMIGPYLAEYRDILEDHLKQAFEIHPGNPMRALEEGLDTATMIILGNIANRAAVDSGRLKGSWSAVLSGGGRIDPSKVVTASAARLIRLANARQRRASVRTTREAARKAGGA
jgi:hypothetical protein